MKDAGSALMGIGEGKGETRAADAARMAISSPLLDAHPDVADKPRQSTPVQTLIVRSLVRFG